MYGSLGAEPNTVILLGQRGEDGSLGRGGRPERAAWFCRRQPGCRTPQSGKAAPALEACLTLCLALPLDRLQGLTGSVNCMFFFGRVFVLEVPP